VSDRQRRSRARLKAGRRVYRVELDEVWAENFVVELGFSSDETGASLSKIVTRVMQGTCRNIEFSNMLLSVMANGFHDEE
jgi:hypothetical protein